MWLTYYSLRFVSTFSCRRLKDSVCMGEGKRGGGRQSVCIGEGKRGGRECVWERVREEEGECMCT